MNDDPSALSVHGSLNCLDYLSMEPDAPQESVSSLTGFVLAELPIVSDHLDQSHLTSPSGDFDLFDDYSPFRKLFLACLHYSPLETEHLDRWHRCRSLAGMMKPISGFAGASSVNDDGIDKRTS